MMNPEHLEVLKQGVEAWNQLRKNNWNINADLRGADLHGADLRGADLIKVNLLGANLGKADLHGADLRGADLIKANLGKADLRGANLLKANLIGANLGRADLHGADLHEANLGKADLHGADLREANLGKADLHGADLGKADLHGADLHEANLGKADLHGADLREANLGKADLSKAQLFEANLERADLSKAELFEANLERANLKGVILSRANMESVGLMRCDMIDSILEGAVLTGAKIWESKRSGWSVKGVICEYAYFDREGKIKTEFKPGEFEKLYSEQIKKIILHYEDGLTQFEVTTLPALIQFIQSRHPGSSLRLRTIGEDVGGASVTVVVDELGGAELSVLKEDFENYKERIREEVKRDAQIEMKVLQGQVNLLTDIIKSSMGNYAIQGNVFGPVGDGSSMGDLSIYNNDLNAISKLISDILAARSEIEKVLPPEKADEFSAAFEVIEEQASAPQKDWKKLKKGAQAVKNVLDSVGETAGKWITIVEKLAELAHRAGMV